MMFLFCDVVTQQYHKTMQCRVIKIFFRVPINLFRLFLYPMTESTPAILELLNDPIKTGYLLAFCESEFNAENMRFILEIDRFRDFIYLDKSFERKLTWQQIDRNVGIKSTEYLDDDHITDFTSFTLCKSTEWKSNIVPYEGIVEDVTKIWNTYLSSAAPHQICIPSKVLSNTKKRLELIHIFGAEIFEETMIDPIKTLNRDVLPRFLVSEHYLKLQERLKSIENLPFAFDLNLPIPTQSQVLHWNSNEITIENLQKIPLKEFVNDSLIYPIFLLYLQSIVSSENLLCLRAIDLFKESFPNSQLDEVEHTEDTHYYVWLLYSYFIAPNSAFEISVSDRRRKYIRQALAYPKYNTFTKV